MAPEVDIPVAGTEAQRLLDVSPVLLGLTEENPAVANLRVRGSQVSIEVQRPLARPDALKGAIRWGFDGLTLIGYEALKRVVIPDICHRPPAQSPPMPKSELAPSLSANSARSAKVVLQHKSKVVAPVQKA
jgi:hypothetical protein